ncbi:MAG: TlpA disulfide reductase family protein [Fimbriimonadales bacterium]
MKRRWTILALSAVMAIGAYGFFQQQPNRVGSPAPNFQLTTLDGKTITMRDLRGKPVLLDFWATWCGPCRRALPHTQKLAQKYAKEAHVLAVNLREDAETVRAFLQQNNFNFTVLMDTNGEVARSYGVRGIPHFVIVDARGRISFEQVGFGPGIEKTLERELKKAIDSAQTER